ncbi:hypothetical protein OUZ56_003110 [Daphnia magna]|uniref:Uncharacterized protein n=1 Tax=Daphnia magna TaxID=35525 RepID=A0ABR0A7S4_9CRUS|nr:hypothetical protein OUZ56_003110 [Daphnia magna]
MRSLKRNSVRVANVYFAYSSIFKFVSMLLCREREGESQLVKLVRATAVSASRQLIDDDAERVTWPPFTSSMIKR